LTFEKLFNNQIRQLLLTFRRPDYVEWYQVLGPVATLPKALTFDLDDKDEMLVCAIASTLSWRRRTFVPKCTGIKGKTDERVLSSDAQGRDCSDYQRKRAVKIAANDAEEEE
jgi:hypothetical protein